jgi:hypothetical protein
MLALFVTALTHSDALQHAHAGGVSRDLGTALRA